MWLQVINKVKVTYQGEGHIKVKVKYLLSFQLYVMAFTGYTPAAPTIFL